MGKVKDLHNLSTFSQWDPTELAQLSFVLEKKSYQQGETLFEPGEASEHMFVIYDGEVTLSHSKDETEQTVTFTNGDLLGEVGILGHSQHLVSATVSSKSAAVLLLSRDGLKRLFYGRPQVGLKLLQVIHNNLEKKAKASLGNGC